MDPGVSETGLASRQRPGEVGREIKKIHLQGPVAAEADLTGEALRQTGRRGESLQNRREKRGGGRKESSFKERFSYEDLVSDPAE